MINVDWICSDENMDPTPVFSFSPRLTEDDLTFTPPLLVFSRFPKQLVRYNEIIKSASFNIVQLELEHVCERTIDIDNTILIVE